MLALGGTSEALSACIGVVGPALPLSLPLPPYNHRPTTLHQQDNTRTRTSCTASRPTWGGTRSITAIPHISLLRLRKRSDLQGVGWDRGRSLVFGPVSSPCRQTGRRPTALLQAGRTAKEKQGTSVPKARFRFQRATGGLLQEGRRFNLQALGECQRVPCLPVGGLAPLVQLTKFRGSLKLFLALQPTL